MKIDVFREHKDEYVMPKEPTLLRVGSGHYLTVDGSGGPNGRAFQEKVSALYGAAYTLKFALKKAGHDLKVGMLEGLWSATGGGKNAMMAPKASWRWKLMIRVPDLVTRGALEGALKQLRSKKGSVPDVKLETIREGRVVQMLHVGAYRDERRTIAKMDAFAREEGLKFRGPHHEIYLSDPRRVPPSRLRTILRHPVS